YCYVKLNRISKAEVYIARAERSIEKTRDENLQFVISITNGLIQKYYRNWDEAINHFEKSIKIIEKFNIPIHYSQALLDFGLLYESKGDFVNSKKYYQKAYVVCQTAGLTVPKLLKTKL
ncbi:MAG: tetratricopeptide repeat protein, partial [Thermoplasmata archaeon]|nr:tetratricopeptide repeat protein [Thermoplasmata archaeon]